MSQYQTYKNAAEKVIEWLENTESRPVITIKQREGADGRTIREAYAVVHNFPFDPFHRDLCAVLFKEIVKDKDLAHHEQMNITYTPLAWFSIKFE